MRKLDGQQADYIRDMLNSVVDDCAEWIDGVLEFDESSFFELVDGWLEDNTSDKLEEEMIEEFHDYLVDTADTDILSGENFYVFDLFTDWIKKERE